MHKAEDHSKNFNRPLLSQDIFRWFQKEWDDSTKRNLAHRLGVKDVHRNATITIKFEYLPDTEPVKVKPEPVQDETGSGEYEDAQ